MSLEEIIAEMQRRPDTHLLIEWIYEQDSTAPRVLDAIDAYYDALDNSGC